MIIDRQLQNNVLHYLKEKYSDGASGMELYCVAYDENIKTEQLQKQPYLGKYHNLQDNLNYLNEHGLINIYPNFKITAKGIDFITDDGGLSAILNVQTITLHQDTIQIIIEAINQSALNPTDKQKFVDELKSLPAESTKHILFELLSKGIANFPSLSALMNM
ncbi:hypothetical protein [Rodentibacter ratti]|uniref:DUF2513 domain-containing protein n=1 Tax=Rodentibacter ratti TaxID=1906745 RepID=A0A1V3L590_9PAST|nr:hypothetical protein [Rodentibacter ratti]OOF85119.1 hypothetical protein BKG88_09145 [Rodentibacter ratti]